MRQLHKDVEVDGQRYQISLLKAAVGSWIYKTFMAKYAEAKAGQVGAPQEDADKAESPDVSPELAHQSMAAFLLSQLSRTELEEVQTSCLLRASRYEDVGGRSIPMPILAGPGIWGVADLEYDGPAVLALVRESIAFNIAPFFPDAGSNKVKPLNPATNQ